MAILALVTRSRPDLVHTTEVTPGARMAAAVTAAAIAVAAGATLWASERPDALESAAAALGLGDGSSTSTGLLTGPAASGGLWLAAGAGVIIAFVAGWAIVRAAARRARVA